MPQKYFGSRTAYVRPPDFRLERTPWCILNTQDTYGTYRRVFSEGARGSIGYHITRRLIHNVTRLLFPADVQWEKLCGKTWFHVLPKLYAIISKWHTFSSVSGFRSIVWLVFWLCFRWTLDLNKKHTHTSSHIRISILVNGKWKRNYIKQFTCK